MDGSIQMCASLKDASADSPPRRYSSSCTSRPVGRISTASSDNCGAPSCPTIALAMPATPRFFGCRRSSARLDEKTDDEEPLRALRSHHGWIVPKITWLSTACRHDVLGISHVDPQIHDHGRYPACPIRHGIDSPQGGEIEAPRESIRSIGPGSPRSNGSLRPVSYKWPWCGS